MNDPSNREDWQGSWYKSAELKNLEKRGFDLSSAEQWMLAFDKSYFAQDKTVVSLLATVANYDARESLYTETQEFLKNGYYNRNISHNLLLKWWTHCAENKDLELCGYLLAIFPPDAAFREDIHYGVYKFQYPITLILQSSWQEGFKLLVKTNVNLGNYRARSSRPCETFYDVERMADQNGVILTQNLRGKIRMERSAIDPLRLRTDNEIPPKSITNKLMGQPNLKSFSDEPARTQPKVQKAKPIAKTKKIIERQENPSEYEWNRLSTNEMVKGNLDPYDIIFKSMPRIGKRSPLFGVWPECAKRGKVSKPVIFEIDFGYLVEAGFGDEYELPTVREYDYEDLSLEEALDYFKDHCEGNGLTSDVEAEIGSPIDEWTEEDVEDLERYFSDYLDSSVDPDNLGRYSLATRSKYGLAILVHNRIGSDLAKKMQLFLVDGEQPGSDFIGVKYTGYDPETLNHWFAKTGLNMIVTE